MIFSSKIQDLVAQALLNPLDTVLTADAVRQSLDFFVEAHPGRAVELRVPPYRVVQILGGTTHRRGTPPAVVEMSAHTWLHIVAGDLSWIDGKTSGQIVASGVGSDLNELFKVDRLTN